MRRRVVDMRQGSLAGLEPEPEPEKPRVIPHCCHVPGCDVTVPPRLLMCRMHWRMVPADRQKAVWRHFNPRQCADGPRDRPTEAWFNAADAAIESVLNALGLELLVQLHENARSPSDLETDPPRSMTSATVRICLQRLRKAKKLRIEDGVIVVTDPGIGRFCTRARMG